MEAAYRQGVPSLGHAAAALLARWRLPLRDGETFLRLAFLAWYQEHEPAFLTGLEAALPSVDDLVAERGGDDALTAEESFTLAILWSVSPPMGADETVCRERARRLAASAAAGEPTSRLFREWRFLLGEADDTARPRIYVEPEVHARFHGRGAMGDYVVHTLTRRLRDGRHPVAPT